MVFTCLPVQHIESMVLPDGEMSEIINYFCQESRPYNITLRFSHNMVRLRLLYHSSPTVCTVDVLIIFFASVYRGSFLTILLFLFIFLIVETFNYANIMSRID